MGKIALHIPFWKIILSYVTDVYLEFRDSEINGDLHVLLVRGRYQLCAKDAIYSFDDLYDNYRKSFELIASSRLDKIDNVLLLGLGLASIPLILEKQFGRNYHYTAVEIDEEVIDLANKYTLSRLSSPLDSILADAYIFTHSCLQKFDLITVDIFINDYVPNKFETKEFLLMVKSLLNKNGILLFNQLGVTEKDRAHAKEFYDTTFATVFPKAQLLKIKGNYMLLNDDSALSQ